MMARWIQFIYIIKNILGISGYLVPTRSHRSFCMSSFDRKLILGSSSVTRRQILSELGFSIRIIKPDINESLIGDRSIGASGAEELVLLLAHSKADAVLEKIRDSEFEPDSILMTCDQVVINQGLILEKPKDEEEFRSFVYNYGVSPCGTVGSIVLTDVSSGTRVSGVDKTSIRFSPIPEDIVKQLILEGDIFYCAGGLMVENPLIAPYIERIEGTIDSVMGLSKDLMLKLLAELDSKCRIQNEQEI